jgi:acyl carrier protein
MSLEALQDLIIQILPEPVPRTSILPETRLVADMGLESIDLIGLIYLCEQRFSVDLVSQGELLANITTVGEVLDFITTLRHAPAAVAPRVAEAQ